MAAKLLFLPSFFFVLNNKRNKMRWEVVSIQVPLDLKSSVRTIAPLGVMMCIQYRLATNDKFSKEQKKIEGENNNLAVKTF